MPPTPQHEALHRIFTHDSDLFTRTIRQVFGTDVPVPSNVSLLNTDYTVVPGLHKRVPEVHDRHGDSVAAITDPISLRQIPASQCSPRSRTAVLPRSMSYWRRWPGRFPLWTRKPDPCSPSSPRRDSGTPKDEAYGGN